MPVQAHSLPLAILTSWLALVADFYPQLPPGSGRLVSLISVGTGSDLVHILTQQQFLALGWLHVEWAAQFQCFIRITNEKHGGV